MINGTDTAADPQAQRLMWKSGYDPDTAGKTIDRAAEIYSSEDTAEAVRGVMFLACDAAGDLEELLWDHHKLLERDKFNAHEFREDLINVITHLVAGAATALRWLEPGSAVATDIPEYLHRLAQIPFLQPPVTLADRMAVHSHLTFTETVVSDNAMHILAAMESGEPAEKPGAGFRPGRPGVGGAAVLPSAAAPPAAR
jgi:hypothetical protein